MAWEVEKCQVASYDDFRYTAPPKSSDDYITIVDENSRELSEDETRKFIQDTVRKHFEKPKVEKLVIDDEFD